MSYSGILWQYTRYRWKIRIILTGWCIFFLYDYRFERVWKNPEADIEKLSRYRAVLSPDFSMYLEMAPVMQMYNVFRNRWCGAYWASKGIRVIPTVN